ncbi:cytosolic arginine sensor for mTORC1 subunit 1 isoform X2 [Nematostella vectensis]|uniref:cytosolic arginine sensor for mTORC1 subunit 1 isoform X2 n=1 Tax=Nematostella vectensis TaxID=45351 RepID=UPI00138FC585|nr:cytosolic arginine sensor for mTORC1 subunit 1 isoform X2 [Nematostella vectensis]
MNGFTDSSLELHILEHKLRVTNVKKHAISNYMHALVKISLLPHSSPKFFSFTETRDGYTVIAEDELYRELPVGECIDVADPLWRVLTVSAGALGSLNLTGISKIVKSVISPLADNKISVLIISTYQSDYVLVKDLDLLSAINCLSNNFKVFMDKGSRLEPVSPTLQEKMNAMQHPSTAPPVKPRPITHPFVCPLNKFYISSLDMKTLHQLTPIILDLMFYSNSRPQRGEDFEQFFHLSIVDGDISLLLDELALSRFPKGSLLTCNSEECWRMIRIGDHPLGFEQTGVVAQASEPLADADIITFCICSYKYDYQLIPESELQNALDILNPLKV